MSELNNNNINIKLPVTKQSSTLSSTITSISNVKKNSPNVSNKITNEISEINNDINYIKPPSINQSSTLSPIINTNYQIMNLNIKDNINELSPMNNCFINKLKMQFSPKN